MYTIGNYVLYGIHGICRICALEKRTVDHKAAEYLVLQPVEQAHSRFLVPTGNAAAMAKLQPIMTPDAILLLLRCEEVLQGAWIADENQRKQTYRQLIHSADRKALLQMIHTLYRQKERQLSAGRRLHLCDENFLRDAQRLIDGEFSFVLGIAPADVGPYILHVWKENRVL